MSVPLRRLLRAMQWSLAPGSSLPGIDRGRHCPNVLFAFGHHHLGLTQAAITGALIADLAQGRSIYGRFASIASAAHIVTAA